MPQPRRSARPGPPRYRLDNDEAPDILRWGAITLLRAALAADDTGRADANG
jgi:hypothetical protein